ncbi:MAG: ATP-dependent 6-phosphofructokinase [SAR324 cluster bacterium]|nr:ATP-dependent 6-phosphofructokinase [SAR324 cluster bacterium]
MSNFKIDSLGPRKLQSPLPFSDMQESSFYMDDNAYVLEDVGIKQVPSKSRSFEAAGPREKIYFDPAKTRVGVVTCGGLCPGINNVIRTLVMQLWYHYSVKHIIGFRYGYEGFIAKFKHDIVKLTPEVVKDYHHMGGSALSSSRGKQDTGEIVDCLVVNNVNILFCIGGDGTLKGAHAIAQEIKKRGLKIGVVGIPKTIDNDILYCVKTFGFETAFSIAAQAIQAAHVEAQGIPYGVVIVKLMGRDSGFIAANTVLASPDVNFVLVPEVDFEFDGEHGMLATLEKALLHKVSEGKHPHSVIVVAEGAGQKFFNLDTTDASGNIRYGDIGILLKTKIQKYFQDRLPINIKYIEPSYMIRSVPANAHDSIFCHHLAENAVHAGMSGKTDMMIGYWNGRFTHVPLEEVIKGRKKIEPAGELWRQVLLSTGQPSVMK